MLGWMNAIVSVFKLLFLCSLFYMLVTCDSRRLENERGHSSATPVLNQMLQPMETPEPIQVVPVKP